MHPVPHFQRAGGSSASRLTCPIAGWPRQLTTTIMPTRRREEQSIAPKCGSYWKLLANQPADPSHSNHQRRLGGMPQRGSIDDRHNRSYYAIARRSDIGRRAADTAAATGVIATYRSRLAVNTQVSHDGDLARWGYSWVRRRPVPADWLTRLPGWACPGAWSRRLCSGSFAEGYAIRSVNHALSTETYSALAAQAGAITGEAAALIRSVGGYSRRAGRQWTRACATRRGAKKATPVAVTAAQVRLLKRSLRPRKGSVTRW